jgi:hypothetical protein
VAPVNDPLPTKLEIVLLIGTNDHGESAGATSSHSERKNTESLWLL